MYEVLDALLIRASTHPTTMDLPPWPDLTSATGPDQAIHWLTAVWAHDAVADAITLATPTLADQVDRTLATQRHDPRELRRTAVSVARYLLRATGRSTPFGLFAGVAPVALGAEPAVRWGQRHQGVTHADRAWIAGVISALEECPALLRRLPVVLNDLAEVGEYRVVLSGQPSAAHDGRRDETPVLVDISVRRTAAVAAVATYARTPIVVDDLLEKLAADFPDSCASAAEAAIGRLVRLRVLLTALRPPMTAGDGLAHLLAQLTAVGADTLPEAADTVRQLCAIADRMKHHDRGRSATGRRAGHRALIEQMNDMQGGHNRPVTVEVRLDADTTVPDSVIRHVCGAATALTRLTPYPRGLPAWREYHAAFLERYGVGAVVPLMDVVDPDIGLGLPATYRGSHRTVAAAPVSDRDRRLLRLAQTATTGGGNEIRLDDRMIDDLAGPDGLSTQPPPHVELFVQIHADSVEALRQDRYTLVVSGASRAAGSTTGRFLRLLDPADRDRFQDAYSTVATGRAGAMPVQVSFPPVLPSSDHLAAAPPMLPTLLSAGEFVDSSVDGSVGEPAIRMRDVAVGGDTDGLFLVSLRHGRVIEPTVFNAVEFRFFSHPLARFLCEAPRARAAVYMPFSWGAAGSLPLLPRVRHGRVVLAPARWTITADDLPPAAAPPQQWRDALIQWRQRFGMPDRVCLVEGDSLLPLDLAENLHQELLRRSLDRHGHARLDEAPHPAAYRWLHDHTHEIAVPLSSTAPATAAPPAAQVRVADRGDAHLPGAGPWLYAKLYASARRTVDILDHVPSLIAECDGPGEWWYLPYGDPEPHLRLRIPLVDAAAYGPATVRLGAWAGRLRRRGLFGWLQLDTYYPETGRFGAGRAMAAAEKVFAADSAAALAELKAAAASTASVAAVTAASLVDIAVAFTGDTAAGMRWLVSHLPHEAAPVDRAVRTAAASLADPSENWAALRATADHSAMLRAWQQRRLALAAYRDCLAPQRDPQSVLPSLLHLHSVRLHGIDPDRERRDRHLARAAALRWSAIRAMATR